MSVTKKRKQVILDMYKDMAPIPRKQLDWCVKNSAKLIFVDKKGNGFCTKCETKVMIPKSKHKEEVKCPNCKRKMEVRHIWRYADPNRMEDRVNWYVFPEIEDKSTIILRYVVINRFDGNEPRVEERARLIMNINLQIQHTLEYIPWEGGWKYSTVEYFRETHFYNYRRWCCLVADPYPYTLNRLKKIDGFERINFKSKYFAHIYFNNAIKKIHMRADLYEKLQKAGFDKLIDYDVSRNTSSYDGEQTSLTKMLGLNNNTLKMLRRCQTYDALKYLRENPNTTEKAYNDMILLDFRTDLQRAAEKYGFSFNKALTYLKKQKRGELKDVVIDYIDYLRTIKELNYPFDKQYLYPKNFRKAEIKADEALRALRDEKRREEIRRQNNIIHKISVALRESESLKKWMNGSNGLKVIVPDSVEELRQEGIVLHNCLGGYGKRVADKETLIFFIRKLNNPNKEYIAMEYSHGKIQQIRLDHNAPVKDAKILEFANHFVTELNKMDVFNKLKEVA